MQKMYIIYLNPWGEILTSYVGNISQF